MAAPTEILIMGVVMDHLQQQKMSVRAPHLPALTGLRFFAAFAIVVLHGMAAWPLPIFVAELALNQGVSFFFVLSGFILTYVYRDLSGKGAVREFYIHRIARIWPVHIAATCFYSSSSRERYGPYSPLEGYLRAFFTSR